jgi:hypothetical protein
MRFCLVLFSFLLSSAFIHVLIRFYHLTLVPVKQLFPGQFCCIFLPLPPVVAYCYKFHLLHMSFVTICAIYWRVFSYVICYYLCHLLACIFICRLSLFVPSTGVYFYMSFVIICAIYWLVFSYVICHYLCHPLACIFICCRLLTHIFLYCYLLLPVAFCCHLFTTGPIPNIPTLSAQSWHQTRTLRNR